MTKIVVDLDQLLATDQAAEFIGVKPDTLVQWRWLGRGPKFIKSSPSKRGCVRYRRSDVLAWQEQNTFANTTQYHVKGGQRISPPWESNSPTGSPQPSPATKPNNLEPSDGEA